MMKAINLTDIATLVGAIRVEAPAGQQVNKVVDALNETPDSSTCLFWCSDKNIDLLKDFKYGTVILSQSARQNTSNNNLYYIVVDKPRLAFQKILAQFFISKPKSGYISPTAVIDKTVIVPADAYIGHHVVIEEGCVLGKGLSIGHNTVIKHNTEIGNEVTIGANNTIGGIGFGYEKNEQGEWEVMPHIGNVVICNKVEIGNNTCIDRAVLGSTWIGPNVKIDNLVHIAHGVKIEENALIIAHAMIGGSAKIGKNVWFGPSASILNKGVIEQNALIGMAAVVIKPVEENAVMAGNPAKMLRKTND